MSQTVPAPIADLPGTLSSKDQDRVPALFLTKAWPESLRECLRFPVSRALIFCSLNASGKVFSWGALPASLYSQPRRLKYQNGEMAEATISSMANG